MQWTWGILAVVVLVALVVARVAMWYFTGG